MRRRVQSLGVRLAVLLPWAVAVPVASAALDAPPGREVSHPAIRLTASAAAAGWYAAALLAACGRAAPAGRVHVSACGVYLLHVAVAFHAGHGWSHAAAFAHVQEGSGFGPGIFVSYLFTLVWVIDAIWLAVSLDGYRARPAWVNRVVHGFMAFVVFNATVVFGSGERRLTFGGLTLLVVAARLVRLGYGRRILRARLWR